MRIAPIRIANSLASIALSLCFSVVASAQGYTGNAPLPHTYPNGNVHRLFNTDAPPGVVGAARLQRWGAVVGHYQAVAFRGPGSTEFSLPIDGVFQPPGEKPLTAGLLIGAVYRFKITSIPGFEGEELFPTVEVIDRTYPPESLAGKFPIPINLDIDDLEDAMQGRLVTRVVYLEDPGTAVPLAETPDSTRAFDIPGNQDPVAVADTLGKPVAIIRIGSLAPPSNDVLLPQFFLGYPPWIAVVTPQIMEPTVSPSEAGPEGSPSAE